MKKPKLIVKRTLTSRSLPTVNYRDDGSGTTNLLVGMLAGIGLLFVVAILVSLMVGT